MSVAVPISELVVNTKFGTQHTWERELINEKPELRQLAMIETQKSSDLSHRFGEDIGHVELIQRIPYQVSSTQKNDLQSLLNDPAPILTVHAPLARFKKR